MINYYLISRLCKLLFKMDVYYQIRFEEELNKEEVKFTLRKEIKVHINEFTSALIKNNVVRKLELSCCYLGDEEMRVFANAIKENKSVTVLDLYCNQFGDIGAKYFFEGIKENKTITVLYLRENQIGEEAFYYVFINAPMKCLTLNRLNKSLMVGRETSVQTILKV